MTREISRYDAVRGLAALLLCGLALWLSPLFHASMLDLFTQGGATGHFLELHDRFNPTLRPLGLFIGDRALERQLLVALAILALPLLIRGFGYALPLGAMAVVPILAAVTRGGGLDGLLPVLPLFAAALLWRQPALRHPCQAQAAAIRFRRR